MVGGRGEAGQRGALWLYDLGTHEPRLVQKLQADRFEIEFANDLDLSHDGAWLAVGGEQAVYVYARAGDRFELDARIDPPSPDAGYFGQTVALSGNGGRLLIGAPRTNCEAGDRCGIAYLFERDRAWSLVRTIVPATNAPDGNFGHHIAISRDGSRAAIQGSVIHVFTLAGST